MAAKEYDNRYRFSITKVVLLNSEWVNVLRVSWASKSRNFQRSGSHSTDCAEPTVAARLAHGRLEQPVQCLQEAISLTGLRPNNDAIGMVVDQFPSVSG